MSFKKWQVADINKELAKELAEECDTDPIVALIASSRGYDDPAALEEFLSSEPVFSSPYEMADIENAAKVVNSAINSGKKITIYGDYDCDGVSATALMLNYLQYRGANCGYYIPDRFDEGYGMNETAVKKLSENGTELIVTVDNGISALKEIAYAKTLGMNVVVTDHHLPGDKLPPADAVVDPHRQDCASAFKEICGAQVAFALICVMENKEPEELLPYYSDILSLAVVADVMPLTLENRSIVKCGIEKIRKSPSVGISALLNASGIEAEDISSQKLAFMLVPRINAAGRMGKADRAVELLTTDDPGLAHMTASEIDEENSLRQQTEKTIFKEAVEKIESGPLKYDRVIVCSGNGWHHGVVGIVAGKLAEKYGKPVILISVNDDGTAHGSGRSIEGFSLYKAISAAEIYLIKFGGHDQAAGISIKEENIPSFRKALNDVAFSDEYVKPVLKLDCKLNPTALSPELAVSLKALEPFGNGNPKPVFGIYETVLSRIVPIGNNRHLKLNFTKGTSSFSALLFGVSPDEFCFSEGDLLDIAVTVDENIYKGEVGITVQIKGIRMSGTDDAKLFSDISQMDAFYSERDFNPADISPNRSVIGSVYRFICQNPVSENRIAYKFMNNIGYGKTILSVRILEELKLITKNKNGILSAVAGAPKTDLCVSSTYKYLKERSEEV